jgi:hypothetical protein
MTTTMTTDQIGQALNKCQKLLLSIKEFDHRRQYHLRQAMKYSGGLSEIYGWHVHRADICHRAIMRFRSVLNYELIEISV